MKDLLVTSVRASLPIKGKVDVLSNNPIILNIYGDKFQQARFVFINDIEITTFSIITNNQLQVVVPSTITLQQIKSISVLSELFVLDKTNLIYFDLGNTVRSLTGIQKLVQQFVKLLLQSPGTNLFNKDAGGGLLNMIGKNTDGMSQPITSDIVDSVNRTKNYIIAKQSKNKRIPLDERLMDVSVNGISVGQDKVSVSVNLILTNMTGRASSALLSL